MLLSVHGETLGWSWHLAHLVGALGGAASVCDLQPHWLGSLAKPTELSVLARVRFSRSVACGTCIALCSPIPASGCWVLQWAEYRCNLSDNTLMTLELSFLEKLGMSGILFCDATKVPCVHTLLLLRVAR